MKATVAALGLVFGALVAVPSVRAQGCCPCVPYAAPTCWYQQNYYCQWFGPNCYVNPPYPPFQGMVFAPPRPPAAPGMSPTPGMVAVPGSAPTYQMPPGMPGTPGMPGMPGMPGYGGIVAFPSHQWMRSPRDFFMWE